MFSSKQPIKTVILLFELNSLSLLIMRHWWYLNISDMKINPRSNFFLPQTVKVNGLLLEKSSWWHNPLSSNHPGLQFNPSPPCKVRVPIDWSVSIDWYHLWHVYRLRNPLLFIFDAFFLACFRRTCSLNVCVLTLRWFQRGKASLKRASRRVDRRESTPC